MTDNTELKALLAKATAGPWYAAGWGDGSSPVGFVNIFQPVDETAIVNVIAQDAALIAAAVNALPRLIAADEERERLADALRALMRGYVSLMETARDRIIGIGGDCDSMERMEDGDPYLRAARAALTNPSEE